MLDADGIETRPRLLIVDDEKLNILVLAEALKQDYVCSVAMNGEEALRIAQADPQPSLILLDVMMPGMDGFEICRRLKADPDTAAIQIIFVTSIGDKINEEQGLTMGAVDYIHKPVNLAIVRARVKLHLTLALHNEFLRMVLDQRNKDLDAARAEARKLLELVQRKS